MSKRSRIIVIGAALLLVAFAAIWFGLDRSRNREPATIRIGVLRIGSSLSYFVANESKLFDKHGVRVEMVRLGDSNLAMEAILKGEVDATDVIGSAVVAEAAQRDPNAFFVHLASAATERTNIHQLIVRKDLRIDSISGLVGRKLGVFPGSQMRAYVRMFLAKHLDAASIEKVELVPLQPPQQIDAMEARRIDAVLALEPTGTQLISTGAGTLLKQNVLFEELSKPDPFVTAFGIVRKAWAKDNPETVRRLLAAYEEAANIIRARPDVARGVMAREFKLSPDVEAKVSLYEYYVGPGIDPRLVRQTFDLMTRAGVLTSPPEAQALIPWRGTQQLQQ